MRAKYLFAIFFACIFLTACPRPYRYEMLKSKADKSMFFDRNLQLDIYHTSAWLDSKKVVLSLGFKFNNKSDDSLKLNLSTLFIFSATDTFVTKNYNGKLVNDYSNKKDILTIIPNESNQDFWIYFFSNGEYSKKGFRRIYNRDTLFLKINLLNKLDTTLAFVKRAKQRRISE